METTLDLSIYLAMWAGGLAGCAALVVMWGIATRGFYRLAAGLVVALGTIAWWAGPGLLVAASTLLAGASLPNWSATYRRHLLAVATAGFVGVAWSAGGSLPVLAGAIALGSVTTVMLLGHWFLVDPRLPRTVLRRLTVLAIGGVSADAAVSGILGAVPWDPSAAFQGWMFVMTTVTTLALLVAVWFALRERGYSGVMAATGLSYLALLTVTGAIVAGRSLIVSGPLLS